MFKIKFSLIILLIMFSSSFSFVNAKDLSEYFNIDDVKICKDENCETVYNDVNGVNGATNFLVKFDWNLHVPSSIGEGDTVVIPFANEVETEQLTSYDTIGFSWTDVYDSDGNKIGQWMMDGIDASRTITIKFSDSAVGKYDINGVFITPNNILPKFSYSDKIVTLTVKDIKYRLKILTYSLPETSSLPTISNPYSSNSSITLMAISPKITIKNLYNLYNNNSYSNFPNESILNHVYFELSLPENLNAEIDKISISPVITGPTNLTDFKSSSNAYQLITMSIYSDSLSGFSLISQNENETYHEFKNRLNEYEYGIYSNGNNRIIVANFGNQPSLQLTYSHYVNKINPDFSEPGDFLNSFSPFFADDTVKHLLNHLYGNSNLIEGKVVLWAINFTLSFPTVKIGTTKKITGVWSWKNANNEIKNRQITVNAKLVVPSSIAYVRGVNKLLLRDKDNKSEIIGATIKLQKKNGSSYEDIGEAVTDSAGMVEFKNLESGTYRYIQTSYINNYNNNSFVMYNDSEFNNVITSFEFDENNGNIVYASNEREKYSVTFLPGEHGNFTDKVFNDIPYGDATPNYDAVSIDGWLFKGWSPERDLYVMENKTYTAIWKKMVKVTTKYLEEGTNQVLSSENIDIDENNSSYNTVKKDIDDYELFKVDGNTSGTRGENDIIVTYYYKKKESNLNIKYLDCLTRREIALSTSNRLYYGDNYDADSYEVNVTIPQNYNRNAANRSNNYKGIVSSDEINVEYCYNIKDSNINSELTKIGTNKITTSNDRVSYRIDYNTTFNDYIGDANIIIVDNLSYKIDVNSSNLDGGIYDDDNKTITWNINTSINSYNNALYNVTKNIELSYIDIDASEDVISNNIVGKTIIVDKNTLSETNYNTYIDVKGTINVKYVESGTNKELIDSITTTDKVGKTYELEEKNIEGFKVINRPKNDSYQYKEGNQVLEFVYERIKYKIVTKSLNEGGKITGDEEVLYGEDSTVDNINIEAEEGYYISSITINGKDIKIPEKQNKLTIPNFTKMMEDKYISVSFEKYSNIVKVSNTLKKSILKNIGIVISLGTIVTILHILYKRKIIFNKGVK